ncbi:MAG: ABC transporter ATP-binding protein [Sporomusa sp.]
MTKLKKWLFLDNEGWARLGKAVFACTLSNLSLMLPFTITTQVFIELLKPLAGQAISWQRMWLLFGFGAASFGFVFFCLKNDYKKTYVASYTQSESNRLNVAGHMRRLPMSFFNKRDLAELSGNIMADCTNIEQLMSSVLPQLFSNLISLTLICLMLAVFNWQMALAMFCTLPVSTLLMWGSRKAQNRQFERHVEAKLTASAQTQEYLEGIKVIKFSGQGTARFESLKQALDEMQRAAMKVQLVSSSFTSLSAVLLRAGVGITVFAGTLLLTCGRIDFITMLMFLLIVVRIYSPFLTVLTMLPDLLYVSVSSRRLQSLMNTPAMEGNNNANINSHSIEFEHVSFSYNDEEVIHDLTASLPAGGITAIVGPSGGGKSTLTRLAARFWDVQKGSVRVGGTDVKELTPNTLMQQMSFVFQDVILFSDTVINNIRIGRPDASDEDIYAVARAAQCDSFIRELPDGYNTMLGENGSTLSGGERQRISIARALLKDAPIVLLDEATASLDPENEVLVQRAISRLVQDKTVVVIAHRLRTITGADKILVLEDGSLVEEGTHSSLMEQEGLYHKMYTLQTQNQQWAV